MEPRVRILIPMGKEGGNRFLVTETYTNALRAPGARAYMIAGPLDDSEVDEALDGFAGLLLTGGGDIDPRYLGETPHPGLGSVDPPRDRIEWQLIGAALERGLPILGICRGCQLLAARIGGRLYQDIASEFPGAIQHAQKAPRNHESHSVALAAGSRGRAMLEGRDEVWVNSFHHQAVRSLPEGWRTFAVAPDGLIEGFERQEGAFAMGVQWHPEGLVDDDPLQRRVFKAFVSAARAYAQGDATGAGVSGAGAGRLVAGPARR